MNCDATFGGALEKLIDGVKKTVNVMCNLSSRQASIFCAKKQWLVSISSERNLTCTQARQDVFLI